MADLVEALDGLGATWSGQRIEAEQLLRGVKRRWWYLKGLGRPHLLEDRWFRLARTQEERRRYGVLISARSAAELEDELSKASLWRHHSTFGPERCSSALNLPEALLDKVADALSMPGVAALRAGYLRSQVERMKVWTQRLYQEPELDAALGAAGMTSELTRMGLLRPFGLGYGHSIGYVPEEVAQFYDVIAGRLDEGKRRERPGRSIADLASEDVTMAPHLVAKVYDGQVPVLDWKEPYRLTDLIVPEEPY